MGRGELPLSGCIAHRATRKSPEGKLRGRGVVGRALQ